ncbi:PTS sugar transporter subunit IIA [Halobacillus shinanisalinarum]|uniref:PTS sugar transporter subunit IIA n=1 Tax=Halobacillus shinanisalinarum TaxID=2932258 RepID=A0ABY4H3E0_9BACI|nr:PTS sugar transporter subunit IIA [Halobacillus shinanisalinarum]UOQ94683.1 PTS sugar transporter subunit IIA [Halobacillus shinanisalinarum]
MRDVYLDESVILLDVEGVAKEEILTVMGRNLVDKGLVKESFIQAIIAREGEFATGLPTAGISVAIPHTDVEHVNRKTISVGVLKKAVDFGVMGDESEITPVKLVFMLAMDEAHSQLSLLQQLMQIFQSEETLKYLVSEKDKTSIKHLLEEKLDFMACKGDE